MIRPAFLEASIIVFDGVGYFWELEYLIHQS